MEGETYLWSLLALNSLCCELGEARGGPAALMGPVGNAAVPGCPRAQTPSAPAVVTEGLALAQRSPRVWEGSSCVLVLASCYVSMYLIGFCLLWSHRFKVSC